MESHGNIENRRFSPLQLAAGIAKPGREKKHENRNPRYKPKYGLHGLRHFFASWTIEQGFSSERLQVLLGHASIQMTFDTYDHLFPLLEDDHAKFAAGELALVR